MKSVRSIWVIKQINTKNVSLRIFMSFVSEIAQLLCQGCLKMVANDFKSFKCFMHIVRIKYICTASKKLRVENGKMAKWQMLYKIRKEYLNLSDFSFICSVLSQFCMM